MSVWIIGKAFGYTNVSIKHSLHGAVIGSHVRKYGGERPIRHLERGVMTLSSESAGLEAASQVGWGGDIHKLYVWPNKVFNIQ